MKKEVKIGLYDSASEATLKRPRLKELKREIQNGHDNVRGGLAADWNLEQLKMKVRAYAARDFGGS